MSRGLVAANQGGKAAPGKFCAMVEELMGVHTMYLVRPSEEVF
jgi:hypothetical protein